jgi:lipoate-protein ligase A
LQHGSILLDIDWEAWASVFSYASEVGRERALRKLPLRMTSLKQEVGRDISHNEVEEALSLAFERTLMIDLESAPLGEEEHMIARRLAKEKYSAEAWTARI